MDQTVLLVASALVVLLLILVIRLFFTIHKKRQLLFHAKSIYEDSLFSLGKSEEEDVKILVARNGFYAGVVLEKKIHHHFLRSLKLSLGDANQALMEHFAFFEKLR